MAAFREGRTELVNGPMGVGIFAQNRTALRALYAQKDWNGLARKVIEVNKDSELAWFYLGESALNLHYDQAARAYYTKSMTTIYKCKGPLTGDDCDGFNLPDLASARLTSAVAVAPVSVGAPAAPSQASPPPVALPSPAFPSVRETPLYMLFKAHPYDGTPATYFPRVAVTIVDWQHPKCWVATAKLWTSRTKNENIGPFAICWTQNMAWQLESAEVGRQLDAQKSTESTGNVRSKGPNPPLRALPDRIARVNDVNDYWNYVHAIVSASGWLPGAPTNLWITGFEPLPPQNNAK